MARALKSRTKEFEFECWGPDRFLKRPLDLVDESGVACRYFPSFFVRYGVELSRTMLGELGHAQRIDPSLITHIHGVQNLQAFLLATISPRTSHLIAQFHDPVEDGRVGIRAAFRWAAFSKVDKFLVPSNTMKDSLPSSVRKRAVILPLGVDTSTFHIGNKSDSRKTGGVPPESKCAMFVGRLVKGKGVDLLFAAVPRILQSIPEFCLLVVGDGPLLPKLKDDAVSGGISEHVQFLGHIDQHDLQRYYAGSDLLVLPSLRDASPRVVLEALACGTPVLSTRVGYVPELAERVGGIRLLGELSTKGIASAVVECLSSGVAQPPSSLGVRSFGWDVLAQNYLSIYREVASDLKQA